jgi:uncharacterized coiled-coil protein SlyX
MNPENDKLAERITELENRLAFQDRTIEDFHQVLYRQQGEIDGLRRELELLRPRLLELLAGQKGDGGHV